jgi:hypothetical protein
MLTVRTSVAVTVIPAALVPSNVKVCVVLKGTENSIVPPATKKPALYNGTVTGGTVVHAVGRWRCQNLVPDYPSFATFNIPDFDIDRVRSRFFDVVIGPGLDTDRVSGRVAHQCGAKLARDSVTRAKRAVDVRQVQIVEGCIGDFKNYQRTRRPRQWSKRDRRQHHSIRLHVRFGRRKSKSTNACGSPAER